MNSLVTAGAARLTQRAPRLTLLCMVFAVGVSAQEQTVQDGVFSAEQVARGEESFLWQCMDCHEIEEFTGADAYLDSMEGETLWEVFEFVWAEMPEDRPAWLPPEEYADILAYVLSVYGAPVGDTDLPTTERLLERIVIVPPELPGS